MKLNAVQVGLRAKSYRALCALLEEPVKGGDSKKAQLKDWGRYFLWEKQGNAFIIKEIYPVPLPSEDGRAKYLRCIEPLLFSLLTKYGGEHETTMRQWGIDLGIFDANIYDEEQQEQFVWEYGVDPYTFQRAINDTAELFKKAFLTALNAMQKGDFFVSQGMFGRVPAGPYAIARPNPDYREGKEKIPAHAEQPCPLAILIYGCRKMRHLIE